MCFKNINILILTWILLFADWFITHALFTLIILYVFAIENKHFDYAKHDKPRIISNKEIIDNALSVERCHNTAGRLSRPRLTGSCYAAREQAPRVSYMYIENPRNHLKLYVHITKVCSFNIKAWLIFMLRAIKN